MHLRYPGAYRQIGAGKRPPAGTDAAKTPVRAGKPGKAGTDTTKTPVRAGKLGKAGTGGAQASKAAGRMVEPRGPVLPAAFFRPRKYGPEARQATAGKGA